jgi:hypothetical protein
LVWCLMGIRLLMFWREQWLWDVVGAGGATETRNLSLEKWAAREEQLSQGRGLREVRKQGGSPLGKVTSQERRKCLKSYKTEIKHNTLPPSAMHCLLCVCYTLVQLHREEQSEIASQGLAVSRKFYPEGETQVRIRGRKGQEISFYLVILR